jgi:fatty-acid desaturase
MCKCSLLYDLPYIYKIFFGGYIAWFYVEHAESSLETAAVVMCLKVVVSCIGLSVLTFKCSNHSSYKNEWSPFDYSASI